MMSVEIVSVTYRRGKKGERHLDCFEDFPINVPVYDKWDWDQIPIYDGMGQLLPADGSGEPLTPGFSTLKYIDLPEDWFGLKFEFVGQLFEGQMSGLEYECDGVGAPDVFEDWVKDLRVMGDALLDTEIAKLTSKRAGDIPKQVTFLTAWQYDAGQGYWGEYWSEWELLGRLDLSKIDSLIIPLVLPLREETQTNATT